MAHRLASEIVGFAMIFGLVAAAGASLLYFVGADIESSSLAGESIINQKISRIAESLRVIRTYALDGDPMSWGVEIVNTGQNSIQITGIHYLTGDQTISKEGCSTMTKIGGAGSASCTIDTRVITDMRFTPVFDPQPDRLAGIIIVTDAGNTFRLFGDE